MNPCIAYLPLTWKAIFQMCPSVQTRLFFYTFLLHLELMPSSPATWDDGIHHTLSAFCFSNNWIDMRWHSLPCTKPPVRAEQQPVVFDGQQNFEAVSCGPLANKILFEIVLGGGGGTNPHEGNGVLFVCNAVSWDMQPPFGNVSAIHLTIAWEDAPGGGYLHRVCTFSTFSSGKSLSSPCIKTVPPSATIN